MRDQESLARALGSQKMKGFWILALIMVLSLVGEVQSFIGLCRTKACCKEPGLCTTIMMAGFGKEAKAKAPPKFDGKGTIERHMRSFMKLRNSDWSNTCDVYVRADHKEKWWFVGKATGGNLHDPVVSVSIQKRVILEHAKLLQSELRLARTLNLWTAPPNTEVEVAQHKQPLTRASSCKDTELMAKALFGPDVGFEPEQYVNEAKGFYVKLKDDGTPYLNVKPNIVSPEEFEQMNLDSKASVVNVVDGDDELKRAAGRSKPRQIIPGKGQM